MNKNINSNVSLKKIIGILEKEYSFFKTNPFPYREKEFTNHIDQKTTQSLLQHLYNEGVIHFINPILTETRSSFNFDPKTNTFVSVPESIEKLITQPYTSITIEKCIDFSFLKDKLITPNSIPPTQISITNGVLTIGDEEYIVSENRKEITFLKMLLKKPNKIVTYKQLLEKIDPQSIETIDGKENIKYLQSTRNGMIKYLKSVGLEGTALKSFKKILVNVRGDGYFLQLSH